MAKLNKSWISPEYIYSYSSDKTLKYNRPRKSLMNIEGYDSVNRVRDYFLATSRPIKVKEILEFEN